MIRGGNRYKGFYSKDALIAWNVTWMPLSWNVDTEQYRWDEVPFVCALVADSIIFVKIHTTIKCDDTMAIMRLFSIIRHFMIMLSFYHILNVFCRFSQ